jgi:DNA-binding CsgD family transcriptional regulator
VTIEPAQRYAVQQRLTYALLGKTARPLDKRLRGASAEMILSLHDPAHCWQVLADTLRDYVDCDRVDAGACDRTSLSYAPSAQASRPTLAVVNVVGLSLPNQSPGVQWLWNSATPLVSSNVSRDTRLDTELAALLLASGTRAMASISLRYQGRDLGVVCIDKIAQETRWNEQRLANAIEFLEQTVSPIIAALSVALPVALEPLSMAERRVAQEVVTGASYKTIARNLGKSFSTIDHQLRSIRRKLGATNHADLVGKLRIANLRD